VNKIFSPDNVYIKDVLVRTGDHVSAQQPVLHLDPLDFESELAKYECDLDLTLISDKKLRDQYLNQFVICLQGSVDNQVCPLNTLLRLKREIFATAINVANDIETAVPGGAAMEADLELATSQVDKQAASVNQTLHQIAKMTDQIREQRALNEAKILSLRRQIEITQHQIELYTIVAPSAGSVAVKIFSDMFVEKGDLLFEIA
jgi:multidrug resistance efflux pump